MKSALSTVSPAVAASTRDDRRASKDASAKREPSASSGSKPAFAESLLNGLVSFFSSLRLTVVLLGLGIVLVFFGTMAQDPLGLFPAQERFFRSFYVTAPAMWAAIKKTLEMGHVYLTPSTLTDVVTGSRLPVFPGGYLIGGLLLLNLVTAHFTRFKWTRKKAGIWLTHVGLILLLLGQLLTDMLSRETTLHLREGEARNYTESEREAELAVIDTTAPDNDTVVSIPQRMLGHGKEISHAQLPFTLRVRDYYPNSFVDNRGADALEPAAASQGVGTRAILRDMPRVTQMDRRDVPSAVVEIMTPEGSRGTWLVSEFINGNQSFTWQNHTYDLVLRPHRHYKPYSIELLKFQHDVYAGTDIPKNFASRILLQRPDTGEKRELSIFMNNPLRYAGETYYQASFDEDDHGTILQVVHNPSWLTPYLSCVLVALGLLVQFGTHLIGFAGKRKGTAAA